MASLLIIGASFTLLTTIHGFLLDSPVPGGNSSSAGGTAQSPVAPFLPDTWAGVGVEGGLGCCHLRLFLVKVFALHVHLVILLLQELVESYSKKHLDETTRRRDETARRRDETARRDSKSSCLEDLCLCTIEKIQSFLVQSHSRVLKSSPSRQN